MPFAELSIVTLRRDLPDHGLPVGAIGTVVGVWRPTDPETAYEVEFIAPDPDSGRTLAVLTLTDADLEPA